MPDSEIPSEAPPSYAQATGNNSAAQDASGHLQPPSSRNRIPAEHRRSMEDENRPLPHGWLRQFDASHSHQYFVDTSKDPPRSIWHHPYDDEQYLSTLTDSERRHIESLKKAPNRRDAETMSTDGEDEHDHDAYSPISPDSKGSKKATHASRVDSNAGEGSSSGAQPPQYQDKPKFGRRLKDKITGTTHEQRVAEREQRAKEEEQQYQQYLAIRGAMRRAYQTGEPQLVGKDSHGKDVYVEPPQGYGGSRGNAGYANSVYVNPYQQGPYASPNARYIRPGAPYGRPYGGGYGGGYGLPLAGGLAGGLLLGGALGGFGGFGA